ncbi:hypothetical protein BGW39_007480 [Mortierella sp. 14UC]|nr:hypothetical protein BGW39_007480 [Mortierella sp. 14UC]
MSSNTTPTKASRRRSTSPESETAQPSSKKPMFSIFQKGAGAPAAPADIVWKTHGTSFIVGEAFCPKAGSKVAAFDLDSTLIKVNGKHKWPKNADDWVWWAAGVPAHLQKLADEGLTLVVITNQGGLDGNANKQKEMKLKFEKICARLNLPMWILISMQKDHNRKPMTGLWHWLELRFLEDDVEIDTLESYYVGDAAGRESGWKVGAIKDFNNTDRKFADSLGITFHTPEHFFLDQACPDHKWSYGAFDPKTWPTNVPLFSPTSTPLLATPGTSELILLCGYPASGKSSFAHKHILSTGHYEYVNQDTLKTRDRCLKAVEEGLKNKKAVVVDNTNPDVATRAPYITLAKKYNVPARCFLFQADKNLATHNNYFRAFHRSLVAASDAVTGKSLKTATTTTTTTTTMDTTTMTTMTRIADGDKSISTTTSTTTDKAVKVTKVRDEPVRERLSEMVFLAYAKKYQEPTLKEGFDEIKKINFIPDEDIRATWERWPKESSQGPPPPKPKLIYGTSIDYQERAKRLRLMGPAPDHDLNPFNAPSVNAIENMFERVMAIAKSSSSASAAPPPARRPSLGYSSRPFSSSARTYERHQAKPEEKDTIAFTSTRLRHEPSNWDSLSSSSRGHVPSTTTLQGPTLTQEELRQHKQELIYQPIPRAPLHTQADIAPPPHVPMKRSLSPEPSASEDMRAVSDDDDDDDVVEILSSDDEEEARELSEEDEEHYSYSDEDELEEEEEFEQHTDGQHVILDSDDDDNEDERHPKEPRWVDELDKAHLYERELRRQSLIQASQETEGTPKDSQEEEGEEDVVQLEDDEAVDEYDDDEAVSRGPQDDEYDDEEYPGYSVSQEETRRQRNELNRQRRGRMGMGMGMGMPGTPGHGPRHPLGPSEPLDLEDDEEEDIVEGSASDEDDVEGVDEYDEGEEGDEVVIEGGEVYSSDEEQIDGDEEAYEDKCEQRAIYDGRVDENALSDAELDLKSPLVQTPQQPVSLSHHLQENLRHLENVMTPRERYDSPSDNVVLLLDSDEEEDDDEYPQNENEAAYDDAEREELEYEGGSQDGEGEDDGQELGEEYDQTNSKALDAWDDNQDANRDEFDDATGSYVAKVDSVVQTSGEDITQDHHVDDVEEGVQEPQESHEQPHAFASSSCSEFRMPQGHASDNVRLNFESNSSQEIEQDELGEAVVEESVELGLPQSSSSPLQDEEIYSQPGSPDGEPEAEKLSRSMDSGKNLGSHDTVDLVDSPRFDHAQGTHSPADVVMAETADPQELSSASGFEIGIDAITGQEQPEEGFLSAGVDVDETGDYKELLQMTEVELEVYTEASLAQIEQVVDAFATTEFQGNSDLALVNEARARAAIDALLKQQESLHLVDITGEQQQALAPFEDPVTQPASVRTALLDRLQSIAQEENIDLQSALTFAEPFTTPSFTPSSYMQPSTSAESLASPTTSPDESTPSSDPTHTTNAELSDLSPIQPRRTRLTRMSTIAQTVRDGQAFMDQLASKSSPVSSKSNSADSHNTDHSSSPSAKRGSTSSLHTRTAANMVLLVKEAREFCAGGPSRVGSGTSAADEETVTEMIEETGAGGGQAVVAHEDRVSTTESQPSTPHKSGVVDLVAELVIQSKVKGHHALRVNPASPGRSPAVNAALSRSSSLEPSVTSPMSINGPQYPLSQPPPPSPLASSSAFTFGQGSPSKSALESPSVGFGFGTSFLTSSKERRISVGSTSSSSRTSPRKGSGLGLDQFGLDAKEEEKEVAVEESALVKDREEQVGQDGEMSVSDVAGVDKIEGEEDDDEEDDSEAEGDSESIATTSEAPPMATGQSKKKKLRKTTGKPKKPPTATVQAKRLRRRELFWQKKQQALDSSSSSVQEEKKN